MTRAIGDAKRYTFADALRWTFLIAVLLRLSYLAVVYRGAGSLRMPDSPAYEEYATWLLGGGAVDVTQRMPGYPIFLAAIRALVGSDPFWPVLAQMGIDSVSCVLIAWLAHSIDRRLALPAGLLAAFNLNMITSAGLVLTESIFMAPFIASLIAAVLYIRSPGWRPSFAAGFFLGIALLVRSVLQFYVPILLVALALAAWRHRVHQRRAIGHVGLAFLAIVFCVLPILTRNVAQFGRLALVSQGGIHSLRWVAPAAREFVLGIPFDDGQKEMAIRLEQRLLEEKRPSLPANPFAAASIMEQVAAKALWELGLKGIAKAWLAGTAINLGAPALVSVPPIANLKRPHFYETSGGDALRKVENFARLAAGSIFFWLMVPAVLWMAFTRLLELLALLRIGRRDGLPPGPSLYLLAMTAYFIAITGPVTGVKYRLPFEPFLIILLASAFVQLSDYAKRIRVNRPRPPASTPI